MHAVRQHHLTAILASDLGKFKCHIYAEGPRRIEILTRKEEQSQLPFTTRRQHLKFQGRPG